MLKVLLEDNSVIYVKSLGDALKQSHKLGLRIRGVE